MAIGEPGPARARVGVTLSCGGTARAILKGQPQRSLKSLAARYASEQEVRILDHFAHADVLTEGLLAVNRSAAGGTPEVFLEMRPTRGVLSPVSQLHQVAYECIGMAVIGAQLNGCGLEVPPWINAQLMHYRDNPLPPEV